MLQVLFIGDLSAESTSQFYLTNLFRLGHSVYPFDPELFKIHGLKDKISIQLYKQPHPNRIAEVRKALVQICKNNCFDLIFVMNQNFLGANTIEELRKVSRTTPTIFYHSHDNNFCEGILKPIDFASYIRSFDFVFTTKSQNVSRYNKIGQFQSFYLPSAYEPQVHCPIPENRSIYAPNRFPVVFVGTYDHSRDPLINTLNWNYLYVWGSGWKKFDGYLNNQKRIHPSSVHFRQYADLLSHSEIALGLLREEAEDRHTQRTFEIPACGALQIAPRNDEIQGFFTENKEIILFDSPQELKEKVEFFLKNPTKAKELARKGMQRCLRDGHTYLHRIQSILKIISKKSVKVPQRKIQRSAA